MLCQDQDDDADSARDWETLTTYMAGCGLAKFTDDRIPATVYPHGPPEGPAKVVITHEGDDRFWDNLAPGIQRQEGGPDHRLAVQRLAGALSGTAPLAMVAPRQGSESAPDLVCRVPTRGPGEACFPSLAPGSLVEFQVEASTMHAPRRRKANLLNSWARRSYPIMVVPCPAGEAGETTERLYRLLQKDFDVERNGPWASPARWAVGRWARPFTVWTVSMGRNTPRLDVFQPSSGRLASVHQVGAFGTDTPMTA
jgi:hypothetical protein